MRSAGILVVARMNAVRDAAIEPRSAAVSTNREIPINLYHGPIPNMFHRRPTDKSNLARSRKASLISLYDAYGRVGRWNLRTDAGYVVIAGRADANSIQIVVGRIPEPGDVEAHLIVTCVHELPHRLIPMIYHSVAISLLPLSQYRERSRS